MFYQPESTCALQNKAISRAVTWMHDSEDLQSIQHQSDDEESLYEATIMARSEVRRLQRRAHVISTEFAQLCS